MKSTQVEILEGYSTKYGKTTDGVSTQVEILEGYSTGQILHNEFLSTQVEILEGYSTFHYQFLLHYIYTSRNS